MSYRKPPILDIEDEKEFRKYAAEHYRDAWRFAADIVLGMTLNERRKWSPDTDTIAIRATFDKLASPRVYLVEKWLKERTKKEAGITD